MRKIPWEESVSVPFASAVYFIGYQLLPISGPIDGIDFFEIGLFKIRCVPNSGQELLRNDGKRNRKIKGKFIPKDFSNILVI